MLMTPYLRVDMNALEKNISEMPRALNVYGVGHRPHIKTHKSTLLAKMQLDAGAIGITASKLGEAEVFFDAGFDHILIAYNLLGQDNLARFARMHQSRSLLTTVDSAYVAEGLNDVGRATGKKVHVLVELNLGENRCGIFPQHVADFAAQLKQYDHLHVAGVMDYHGSINQCADEAAIFRAIAEERDALLSAQATLRKAGFAADITSAGSTVAACFPEHLQGVSETRCGSYVFGDVNMLSSGVADVPRCALRAVATVISLPAEGRATLDLGSKTLSSDRAAHDGFGLIVQKPTAVIEKLNEEHAIVKTNGESFTLGERVEVIPNHCCTAVNLASTLFAFKNNEYIRSYPVEARGLYR